VIDAWGDAARSKGHWTPRSIRPKLPSTLKLVHSRCYAGMGMPRRPVVELKGEGQLYLVDSRNTQWRVHDVAFGPPLAARFKRKRLKLSDERATDRWFVSEDGDQRCYHFVRDDQRDLLVETLDRQLRAAGVPSRGRFDGAKHYTP